MQTAQRNSLELLRWMMVASLALPVALFAFASYVSYGATYDEADREISRSLDVAHEHALKVFETIDRSLSEIEEIIRGLSDAEIKSREQSLHLRLRQLSDSLPQMKSACVFDAQGRALVNSTMYPAPEMSFADRDYFSAQVTDNVGTFIGSVLTPRPPYLAPASSASAGGARQRRVASPASSRLPSFPNISSASMPGSAALRAVTLRCIARTEPCSRVFRLQDAPPPARCRRASS